MRKQLLLIASVIFLAACSSPKYAYYFDHYDYNSGKKQIQASPTETARMTLPAPSMSPLSLDEQAVTASAGSRIQPVERIERAPLASKELTEEQALLARKYSSLTKAEKKEFRKEVKTFVKKAIKAKKEGKSIDSIDEAKAMDHDLKMALIFTVVAIVLGAFWSANSVFGVLSLISLVVAIIFFIQWIARQ